MKVKIAVVEEQGLLREGLISLLNGCSNFKVILDTQNILEAFDTLENQSNLELPDLLLVNLFRPSPGDFQVVEKFRLKFPELKIVLLIKLGHLFLIKGIARKSSSSCRTIGISFIELVEILNSMIKNGYYNIEDESSITPYNFISVEESKINFNPANLSQREIEIMKCLCEEYTSREISQLLFISPKTVHRHRENMLRKIGVKNIVGLVVYAMKHNFFR